MKTGFVVVDIILLINKQKARLYVERSMTYSVKRTTRFLPSRLMVRVAQLGSQQWLTNRAMFPIEVASKMYGRGFGGAAG